MNKAELIGYVAEKLQSPQSAAERTVNTVIEGILHGLKTTGNVQLVGFGAFSVKERKARKGRNPATGEPIEIPASKTVKFKPSKGLPELLAQTN